MNRMIILIILAVICALAIGHALGRYHAERAAHQIEATWRSKVLHQTETAWRSEVVLRQRVCDRALDLASRDKYTKEWALQRATAEERRSEVGSP